MVGSASGSARSRFVDSVERESRRRLGAMREVYSVDPTPALRLLIEQESGSSERKLRALRAAHERFEGMMGLSDDELRIRNSNERIGPVFGDPRLVSKIMQRKMGEPEYDDLVNGPDIAGSGK